MVVLKSISLNRKILLAGNILHEKESFVLEIVVVVLWIYVSGTDYVVIEVETFSFSPNASFHCDFVQVVTKECNCCGWTLYF